jgi:hypothetical protein
MKKIFLFLLLILGLLPLNLAWADIPVISANGYICGKTGQTVTCKGPHPNGKDTITGTGHDIVYLTINTEMAGQPVRYTYFSDTGCLVGYTFNAAGQPVAAVAAHRSGAKKTFEFGEGKYDPLIEFCSGPAPSSGTASAEPAKAPEKKSAKKE